MKSNVRHIYTTGDAKLDHKIKEIIRTHKQLSNQDLVEELMITALKLGQDSMDRGDIKLINTAMKELRYAFKVFYPYQLTRKVAIFGSARTPKTALDYKLACAMGREIAKKGWMVITGASSGIMRAGNEGAGREKSFGVNIRLPFEQETNAVIADDAKLISFKYFFTRKLVFIRESDATVLFPGGFGTHDEGYETLTLVQTGKTSPRPIVCLDSPRSGYWKSWRDYTVKHLAKKGMIHEEDLDLIHFTHDVGDAVKVITDFYKNYHSIRFIRDLLAVRIQHPLNGEQMEELNVKFKDIVKKGKITQHSKPFAEEVNEPQIAGMYRLALYFNRHDYARLKQLIDTINRC